MYIIKRKINSALRILTRLKDLLIGGGYNFAYPQSLQIEVCLACNLKCSFCNEEIKTRTSNPLMSLDNFKKIIDKFPYLLSINLSGFGEALLNKDLFKMIDYAKSKNIRVHFATNATLLNQEMTQKILDSRLDSIIFSIDSAIPERYNSLRQGADFNQVIKNIENFMTMAKDGNYKIRTDVYTVATLSEMKYFKNLVDLIAELKIHKIWFRSLFEHSGKHQGYDKDALYHPQNVVLAEKCFQELRKYARQKGIGIYISPLKPQENYLCRTPYMRPYITVEGYVTPCCFQGIDPRNFNFGNVLEQDFKKIRNNKKYRNFRKKLASKNPPFICKYCPRFKGLV